MLLHRCFLSCCLQHQGKVHWSGIPQGKTKQCICKHTCMHTQTHTFIHMNTCTQTHAHTHAHTHTCAHAHPHMHARMHTHTQLYACTYACVHTHTHAHTHTQTHTHTINQHILISISDMPAGTLFILSFLVSKFKILSSYCVAATLVYYTNQNLPLDSQLWSCKWQPTDYSYILNRSQNLEHGIISSLL